MTKIKGVKKINQEKVNEIIKKVGDADNYQISWEEGNPKFKAKKEIKKGKSSKAKGLRFETKVKEDLEEKGWVVAKWMNTVDFERDKVAPAKRKYNPFNRAMTLGTGFPDLICFKPNGTLYDVLGIEVKTTGSLTKIEKGMCIWYLEKGIFPRILIARKKQEGRKIIVEYEDFRQKYMDKKKK